MTRSQSARAPTIFLVFSGTVIVRLKLVYGPGIASGRPHDDSWAGILTVAAAATTELEDTPRLGG